jgi:hypothetical protein
MRIANAPRPQQLTPRYQRAKHGFRERGPHAHQPAKLLLRDRQHPAPDRHTTTQRATLARQQIQLAHEATPPVRRDHDSVLAFEAPHLDLALQDHEQVIRRLARREQQLPRHHRSLAAELGDVRELGVAQHWKRGCVLAAWGAHLCRACCGGEQGASIIPSERWRRPV